MEYYSHHIGDFLSATMHLSHEERSVYLGLMWMYYDKETPIEANLDKLARRLRTSTDLVEQILEEFFDYDAVDGWRHGRIDGEISKYQAKLEQASLAGKASARARRVKRTAVKRSLNAGATDAQPTNNHKPITNNQSSLSKDKGTGLPPWLNVDAWHEFVQHRREMRKPLSTLAANKALKKLEGLTPTQQAEVIDQSIQARWAGLFPDKIVKEQGGKTNGKLILPRDDEKLWDFAKQHGLPAPGQLTYKQYRSRLQSEIEKRRDL